MVAGVVQRSLYGGVLILVIIAVRILWLDRLPKRTFPVLWSLALARLLLPFSFPSVFSLYTFRQRAQRQAAQEQYTGRMWEGVTLTGSRPAWTVVQDLALGQEPAALAEEGGMRLLGAVWCAGALALAVFFAAAYVRSLWQFRLAVPVEDGRVRQWLDRCAGGRIGRIAVRQSDRILAPLTYGCLRPVILLPGRALEGSGQELRYILQHEFVHIRHHDAALKLAMVAALCLHWFNPLAWAMCRLMNRDLELACDEGVLRRFGEEARAGYAMTLIGMEEKKHVLLPLYNGFSKNAIEERVSLIMRYKKIKHGAIMASLMLVACMALVFATSARTAQATEGLAQGPESGGDSQAYGSGREDLPFGSGAESLPMDPPSGMTAADDWGEDADVINAATSGEGSGREAQSLSEDGRKLEQLALSFWEAYLAGDAEKLAQYLAADYEGDVETFPDGVDGHVAAQAQLLAIKGPDIEESAVKEWAVGDEAVVSAQFRPWAEADSLEYLTIMALKEGDGWKVSGYGLER